MGQSCDCQKRPSDLTVVDIEKRQRKQVLSQEGKAEEEVAEKSKSTFTSVSFSTETEQSAMSSTIVDSSYSPSSTVTNRRLTFSEDFPLGRRREPSTSISMEDSRVSLASTRDSESESQSDSMSSLGDFCAEDSSVSETKVLPPVRHRRAGHKRRVTVEEFDKMSMPIAQATFKIELNTINFKLQQDEGRSFRKRALVKKRRTVRLSAVYQIRKGEKAKQKHRTEWYRSRQFATEMVDVREAAEFKLEMAVKKSARSKRRVAGYIKLQLSEKRSGGVTLTGDRVVAYGRVDLHDFIDSALIKGNGDWSEHELFLFDKSLEKVASLKKSRKMKSAAMKAVATVSVRMRLQWPADVVQSFHKQFSVEVLEQSPLSLMSRRPAKLRLTVLGVMFGTDHMATWKGLALPMLTQSLKEEGTSSKYFDDQLTYVSVRVSHKVKDMREVVLHSTEYNSKDADVVYIGEEFEFDLVPYKRDEGELGLGIVHPQEAYGLTEEAQMAPGCILLTVRKLRRAVACALLHAHQLVASMPSLEPGSRKSDEILCTEPMYKFVKASTATELRTKAPKARKSEFGQVFCKYFLEW